MADEPITLSTLAQFHRDVVLPDIERVVEGAVRGLRDEMHGLFDSLSEKIDRLETGTRWSRLAPASRGEARSSRQEARSAGGEGRQAGASLGAPRAEDAR
jgi:hypothetical protein